jgi:hypothetical protein
MLLSFAGMGFSAAGQVRAGNAAGELADYNAAVLDQRAIDARARGQEDESRFRSRIRQLIGSQRAGYAGQNVDVGTGSAADVQADTAYLGELDALQLRANAVREAWG